MNETEARATILRNYERYGQHHSSRDLLASLEAHQRRAKELGLESFADALRLQAAPGEPIPEDKEPEKPTGQE